MTPPKERARMTEEWRTRFATLRDARKSLGLCERCNEPARPGKTQCVQHAKAQSARALANYYRRLEKARAACFG